VSDDHDVKTRADRIEVEFLNVVKNVDERGGSFCHSRFRQPRRPATLVHVPFDGDHRRDGLQSFEDPGFADVSGVDNQTGPGQRFQRRFTEQSVGIGDDAHHAGRPAHPTMLAVWGAFGHRRYTAALVFAGVPRALFARWPDRPTREVPLHARPTTALEPVRLSALA